MGLCHHGRKFRVSVRINRWNNVLRCWWIYGNFCLDLDITGIVMEVWHCISTGWTSSLTTCTCYTYVTYIYIYLARLQISVHDQYGISSPCFPILASLKIKSTSNSRYHPHQTGCSWGASPGSSPRRSAGSRSCLSFAVGERTNRMGSIESIEVGDVWWDWHGNFKGLHWDLRVKLLDLNWIHILLQGFTYQQGRLNQEKWC